MSGAADQTGSTATLGACLQLPEVLCLPLILFVFLSPLLAGSDPPWLFPSPASKSIFSAHTAVDWKWPVPAVAGNREMGGPWQCNANGILLLLVSAAKCKPHEWSNQVYVAREEMKSPKGMGFRWKSPSWLRKPCLFLHLWILVLFVWVQGKILPLPHWQISLWPCWKEDEAPVT